MGQLGCCLAKGTTIQKNIKGSWGWPPLGGCSRLRRSGLGCTPQGGALRGTRSPPAPAVAPVAPANAPFPFGAKRYLRSAVAWRLAREAGPMANDCASFWSNVQPSTEKMGGGQLVRNSCPGHRDRARRASNFKYSVQEHTDTLIDYTDFAQTFFWEKPQNSKTYKIPWCLGEATFQNFIQEKIKV